jgi:hypothetical protein
MTRPRRFAAPALAAVLAALGALPAFADGRVITLVRPTAPVASPPTAFIPPPFTPGYPPPVAVPAPLPPAPPQVTSFTPPQTTILVLPERRRH